MLPTLNVDREFEVVIFGASGFTGKFVAMELGKCSRPIRWAIAGRNLGKLTKVKESIEASNVSIILADVNDDASMNEMCRRTKILLNCTGPYRFYGENVVKACILNKTHYLDITGEPEFIESMMLKYHESAKANHIYIINACGFDSIPSDLGTVYTTEQYPQNGCASSVEAFISLENVKRGHYTTYECIVHGLANADNLRQLRSKLPKVQIGYVGPRISRRKFGFNPEIGSYFVMFPGADASIVRNSQKFVEQNKTTTSVVPVQFAVYIQVKYFLQVFFLAIFAVVLLVFTQFQTGKKLLLRYPRIFTCGTFSHEGPTIKEMQSASFTFTFMSMGYTDKKMAFQNKPPNFKVVTTVSGPDPGYIATSKMLVQSALCVLDGDVNTSGGVITTASAFRDTALIRTLNEHGIKFETLSATELHSDRIKSD